MTEERREGGPESGEGLGLRSGLGSGLESVLLSTLTFSSRIFSGSLTSFIAASGSGFGLIVASESCFGTDLDLVLP